MIGNDLNPVAWFVVKQELANVDLDEVKRLLADIEAEVRPQIIPYYYCDGPNGEKGKWTHVPTKRVMNANFDPLSLSPEQRREYSYVGPEILHTFLAKHGPCNVTGCGHRTPLMVMAIDIGRICSMVGSFWCTRGCFRRLQQLEPTHGMCASMFLVPFNSICVVNACSPSGTLRRITMHQHCQIVTIDPK